MAELAERAAGTGVVSRAELSELWVDGEPHKLIDRNSGIWNPRRLSSTLSIVSSPDGDYSDSQNDDGFFHYDYQRGSDEGQNTKLRRAGELSMPIIVLRRLRANLYVPIFPAYVVEDNRKSRQFIIALDESLRHLSGPSTASQLERSYAKRVTRQRLHQAEFRGLVMNAYRGQCAVCNLKHSRLLDAAHITPDSEQTGIPVVTNGLSLCKIHHAAYDTALIGISSDYTVHVNPDVLLEIDGPMLKHGIQEMEGRVLTLPTAAKERPDRERLDNRFSSFARGLTG